MRKLIVTVYNEQYPKSKQETHYGEYTLISLVFFKIKQLLLVVVQMIRSKIRKDQRSLVILCSCLITVQFTIPIRTPKTRWCTVHIQTRNRIDGCTPIVEEEVIIVRVLLYLQAVLTLTSQHILLFLSLTDSATVLCLVMPPPLSTYLCVSLIIITHQYFRTPPTKELHYYWPKKGN